MRFSQSEVVLLLLQNLGAKEGENTFFIMVCEYRPGRGLVRVKLISITNHRKQRMITRDIPTSLPYKQSP